jgi:hypothetical protein
LVTLPIPKVITGQIPGARINYEIAEILTHKAPGASGFNVLLTGPVTEAVYIFNTTFFWVQAVFMGALAGLLCVLAGVRRSLLVLLVEFALMFGFVYGRAGVAATLPVLVNSYLPLYALVLLFWSEPIAIRRGSRCKPSSTVQCSSNGMGGTVFLTPVGPSGRCRQDGPQVCR